MTSNLLSLLTSIIGCLIILSLSKLGVKIFDDNNLTGRQKIHEINTPRIGGLGIFFGIIVGGIFKQNYDDNYDFFVTNFIFYSAATIFIGVLEDSIKDISIKIRLIFMALSAVTAIIWMNVLIKDVGISFIDKIFVIEIISYIFTIFCIVGLINSYNIIDGLNGLASISGLLALLGLCYVGNYYGEFVYSHNILIFVFAILGFLIFNYPTAKLFLGDSGAYLIGLIVAVNTIYLVNSVKVLSPFFAILLNAYPIIETIFTIYRRKFISKKNIGGADDKHLHSILYKILCAKKGIRNSSIINSLASTIILIIPTTSCFLALTFRESQMYSAISLLLILALYLLIYTILVRFNK
jgi:UDP-N-acetylmuramyl pentapeptide phosphotransferase/UDP-N-acetylglucosamine-1-phosphate transferase